MRDGHYIDPNYLALYEEALRYDKVGDVYTAVKLLKKVIRLAPEWPEGYVALGSIYDRRKEWKPAFHYFKKAVAIDANDREAWWKLSLAATGLGRLGVAGSVWTKFGFDKIRLDRPVNLEIRTDKGFEILWMQALDAARGRILSIPHPHSGLRFRDMMLYDRRSIVGSNVHARKRVNVYRSLDRLKKSPYLTFSCLLHSSADDAVNQLEKLCFEAGLGFEVWSNASRTTRMNFEQATKTEKDNFPEYYNDLVPRPDHGTTLVAMAAIHQAEVERVLNTWEIISLEGFSDLRSY
ncbi:tetratricopeptide repeat protein [Neolewinella antarctica]|uniref:Tetratricopeptide (TPR) repeat protein n=1 Tax=Neolewinella antarctica TaxID=442734 RepID=A0ABX0XD52_9BACT|nr:hypothetical protein [Neolewinella antarctica]NJC27195.1 tetratricopeptide (TPR) repeat protein [Neolewinella antarctica]